MITRMKSCRNNKGRTINGVQLPRRPVRAVLFVRHAQHVSKVHLQLDDEAVVDEVNIHVAVAARELLSLEEAIFYREDADFARAFELLELCGPAARVARPTRRRLHRRRRRQRRGRLVQQPDDDGGELGAVRRHDARAAGERAEWDPRHAGAQEDRSGTLISISKGELTMTMTELLEAKDRNLAGKTVSAKGLFFLGPRYDKSTGIKSPYSNLKSKFNL